MRVRSEKLPGGPLIREVLQNERELAGGLIAGGVAFRLFLWLVPLGLVAAAVLSFWSEQTPTASSRPPAVSASAQRPLRPPPKHSTSASEARCSFSSSGSSSWRGSRSVPSGRCSWPTHSRGSCRRRGSATPIPRHRSVQPALSPGVPLFRPERHGSRPRSAVPPSSALRSRSHSRLRSRSTRCGCSPSRNARRRAPPRRQYSLRPAINSSRSPCCSTSRLGSADPRRPTAPSAPRQRCSSGSTSSAASSPARRFSMQRSGTAKAKIDRQKDNTVRA